METGSGGVQDNLWLHETLSKKTETKHTPWCQTRRSGTNSGWKPENKVELKMTANLGVRVDWVVILVPKRGKRGGRGWVGRSVQYVLLSLRCHGIQRVETNRNVNLELWGKKLRLQHRFVFISV